MEILSDAGIESEAVVMEFAELVAAGRPGELRASRLWRLCCNLSNEMMKLNE